MLSISLVVGLSFATAILAQTSCGPIEFTSRFGPLFVEDNGNPTVPYDNSTALPGSSQGSAFYIASDSSMTVATTNGTTLYCHLCPWIQCDHVSTLNQSTGYVFTIGSDGLLYVQDNSDFYLASEYSDMTTRPTPSHLYPKFLGSQAFTTLPGHWGYTVIQLKASGCYAGHAESGQTAPTPTASMGTSVAVAAATAKSVAMGLGAAMLGLAALV